MAIAKQVGDVEPTQLDWLEVEDEDGAKFRYSKRGCAPDGATLHVGFEYHGGSALRAKLVRGADGKAVLRQDGPGLPAKIVVEYATVATPLGVWPATWSGPLEYEQV